MRTGWKRTKYLIQYDAIGNTEDNEGTILGGSSQGDPKMAKWAQLNKATLTEHPFANTPDPSQENWAATAALEPGRYYTRWIQCRDLDFNANDFTAATNGAVFKKITFFVYLGTFTEGIVPQIAQTRIYFASPAATSYIDVPTTSTNLAAQGIYKIEWENDGRLDLNILTQRLNPDFGGVSLQFLVRLPQTDQTAAIYFDGIEAQIEFENGNPSTPIEGECLTASFGQARGNYAADAGLIRGFAGTSTGQTGLGGRYWEQVNAPGRIGFAWASRVTVDNQSVKPTHDLHLALPEASEEFNALSEEGNLSFTKLRVVWEIQSNDYSSATGEIIINPTVDWPSSGYGSSFRATFATFADDGTVTVDRTQDATTVPYVYTPQNIPLVANQPRNEPDGAVMFEWDAADLGDQNLLILNGFNGTHFPTGFSVNLSKTPAFNGPVTRVSDTIYLQRPRLSTLEAFGIDVSDLTDALSYGEAFIEIRWDVLAGASTTATRVHPAALVAFTGHMAGTSSATSAASGTLGVNAPLVSTDENLLGTIAGLSAAIELQRLPIPVELELVVEANLKDGYDQFFEPLTDKTRSQLAGILTVASALAAAEPQTTIGRAELTPEFYVTGDTIIERVLRFLPSRWFGERAEDSPTLADSLEGPAAALGHAYDLIRSVEREFRLANATGTHLDIIANDFFGAALLRRKDETDQPFRARIKRSLLREKVTRTAIYNALQELTGADPKIFELNRPSDTGGYGAASHLAYGDGTAARVDPLSHPGGYGSRTKSHCALISVSLPPPVGIPLVAGYSSVVGGYASVKAITYPVEGALLWGAGNWAMAYASSVPEPDAITIEDVRDTLNTFGGAGTQFWVNSSTRSA